MEPTPCSTHSGVKRGREKINQSLFQESYGSGKSANNEIGKKAHKLEKIPSTVCYCCFCFVLVGLLFIFVYVFFFGDRRRFIQVQSGTDFPNDNDGRRPQPFHLFTATGISLQSLKSMVSTNAGNVLNL